jgi:excinuclease ABC subunit A
VKSFEIAMVTLALYISKRRNRRQTKVLLPARFFVLLDDKMIRLDEIDQHSQDKKDITLIIDRICKRRRGLYNRLADAIQTAFYEGKGNLNSKQI